ncbi:unnamed protein product [Clonostachys chloroleuca]|uniref:Xylanolytic transcriptional activator regulatory domain-containing protein n=1 Tax=Clonostachys chloroleuca TaxID=1926264 RepID=A0AA35LU16_9HYPO|nr:unnamed protein product [Clonostachys chloroleuca]
MRNLPLPPIDKVFACLRMAKDCPQVATLWLGHFMKPSQFHDYFIKVVSPGPASEADLIIVHCGLYWLFCECSRAVLGQEAMKDYDAQSSLCQANLETVLANFHFHHPTTMDLAYAMGFACMYCLQKSKISSAWSFVSFAAHTIHALGLQHQKLPMSPEGPEDRERRRDMFWTIYSAEKTLSLRLGRASNFRDQDITLARPVQSRPGDAFLAVLAPAWVSLASIQGRIYDEIYSPGALMQPAHVRTSRARALAEELNVLMQRAQQVHEQYAASKGHILGLDYHEIARRSDRVMGLCFLTLIYRSITPEKPSTSEFCDECIRYARDTLQEHERCVGVINKSQGKPVFLETYINWYIIRSPFIPFIVIFCYVVETSQASDLKHLGALVETLDSISNSHAQSTFSKQRSLFRALYDVACKYIEVKSRENSTGQVGISWSAVQQEYATGFAGTASAAIGLGSIDPSAVVQNVPMAVASNAHSGSMMAEDVGHRDRPELLAMVDPLSLHNPGIGDVDMEMDPSGAQLWDWFNKNQSIMRMLEDT